MGSSPSTGATRPPPSHSLAGHLRAVGLFLALTVLVVGLAYPVVVTEIAQAIDAPAANGSLVYYPNGTIAGSSLVAQNTDAPYLFWERPSLSDYSFLNGTPSPPGASDPALQALINETLQYMREYGNQTVIVTVPLDWAAPSASALDPDLTPSAVLVQIPRVSAATNLSNASLQAFVNEHIDQPMVPYIGVPYVDVLKLDLDLLPMIGR